MDVKPKRSPVMVYIDVNMKAQIRRLAAENGRSMSGELRMILREALRYPR